MTHNPAVVSGLWVCENQYKWSYAEMMGVRLQLWIVLRDIWIIESTDPGCLFTFSFKDFYLARYLLIQTESRVPASIHMISLSCVHCIALYVYVYMCIHKY